MISMRLVLILASLAAGPVALANPTQAVPLTAPTADGPDKEVKQLVDTPFVKLVSITLRKGTVLADHAAPVAVTLSAAAGSGTVKVGAEVMPLGAGHLVVLAPHAVHSVTPAGEAPLVVLVHYLKGGSALAADGNGPHGVHGACSGGKCAGGECACKEGEFAGGKCACKSGQCAGGGECACPDGKCAGGGECACQDGKCACGQGKP